MASYANPVQHKGDPMERQEILIKTSESWKKGQFLYLDTSGELNEVTATSEAPTHYALSDQAAAAAGATAEVAVINADTEFLIKADAAVNATDVGQDHDLVVSSNEVLMDVDATAGSQVLRCVDYLANIDSIRHKATDNPGFAIVKIAGLQ